MLLAILAECIDPDLHRKACLECGLLESDSTLGFDKKKLGHCSRMSTTHKPPIYIYMQTRHKARTQHTHTPNKHHLLCAMHSGQLLFFFFLELGHQQQQHTAKTNNKHTILILALLLLLARSESGVIRHAQMCAMRLAQTRHAQMCAYINHMAYVHVLYILYLYMHAHLHLQKNKQTDPTDKSLYQLHLLRYTITEEGVACSHAQATPDKTPVCLIGMKMGRCSMWQSEDIL
jgi:hypothetical protein